MIPLLLVLVIGVVLVVLYAEVATVTTVLLILVPFACLAALCGAVLFWLDSDPRPAYDDGADFKYLEPLSPPAVRGSLGTEAATSASARGARTQAVSDRSR